jgi:hypothetical protein
MGGHRPVDERTGSDNGVAPDGDTALAGDNRAAHPDIRPFFDVNRRMLLTKAVGGEVRAV